MIIPLLYPGSPHTPAAEVMLSQPSTHMPGSSSTQNDSGSPPGSSTTLSVRSNVADEEKKARPRNGLLKRTLQPSRFKLREDFRARLPPNVSRFLGYRPPSDSSTYDVLPIFPCTLLNRVSPKHEAWILAFFGALGSIFLIEAIMSAHTSFQVAYHSPLIISSFGASAVLVFGVIESPLAQPRNLVFGHFVSALVGVAMTRLWVRNGSYNSRVENTEFYAPSFVNGGLSMSLSLLAQLVLGIVHPPGGATGLAAATEQDIVLLSWHYLPVVVASSLIMLGWAMIVNNLGRRRYPVYWWSMHASLVSNESETLEEKKLADLEEGALREAEDEGREPNASREDTSHTRQFSEIRPR